ncbi:hypothetical protein Ahy_A03g016106 [Arachis hypogaea]|uniref:Uncharacterized protein n=1 Tax=Arachis hypogaea TaxID=3818 RepID=A0A445E2A2_ARAHY|nr:hypothetical protein Ahy_A03g016106 [Arachis hypogaea]
MTIIAADWKDRARGERRSGKSHKTLLDSGWGVNIAAKLGFISSDFLVLHYLPGANKAGVEAPNKTTPSVLNPRVEFGSAPTKSGSTVEKYQGRTHPEDASARVLSQNDSIARIFEKEKPGRVRGVGFGPTPSQLFGPNSHVLDNGVQLEETQRKLLELQAELEGKKLKRKTMEDDAAAVKKKMKAMESALIYLFQRQGEELPLDIAAGMSFVE